MDITVDDVGTLRKQVTITFKADEVQNRESGRLGRYANQAQLRGFRKGKAPKEILKKRYGGYVHNEVVEDMLNEAMKKAFKDHGLHPIGPFTTEESHQDGDVRHVVSFDVRPAIVLPDPASLSVPLEDTAASAAELEEELGTLARRLGEHRELGADEALAADDAIRLTGSITAGEETVREVHDLSHVLGAYPLFGKDPAAVLELVGEARIGSSLSFDTTLPDTFRPEAWAGKEAHISVTIQSAQRLIPATLDDEAAKRVGLASLDELRERVGASIAARKEQALHQRQVDALIDELIARTSFELPPKLFSVLVEDQLAHRVREAKARDADADEATVRSEGEQEAREQGERWLRRLLLMDGIAETFGVQATREDLEQQIQMAAMRSGRKPEEIAKELQSSGRMMEVANEIRQHKALQLMLQKVVAAASQPSGVTKDA